METKKRSLAKAITYRIGAFTSEYIFIYALTRSLLIPSIILSFCLIFHTIWFFCHERLWNLIGWWRTDD